MQAGQSPSRIVHKSFDKSDDSREGKLGKIEVIRLGQHTVSRMSALPGWRWTKDVKPLAKTDLCNLSHLGFVMRGALAVELEGNTEIIRAGEVFEIPAGHDAWVYGQEPVLVMEFERQVGEKLGHGIDDMPKSEMEKQ